MKRVSIRAWRSATVCLLNLDEGPKANSACYLEGVFRELFVRGHGEIAAIGAKFELMTTAALSAARHEQVPHASAQR